MQIQYFVKDITCEPYVLIVTYHEARSSGCPTSEGHLVKVVTSGYLSCKGFSLVEVGYKKQMHISLCNQ